MTKTFVSYSRKDTDFVRKLTDALVAQKMEIWIDWKNIPPTVDWKLQIQKGVEEADTFLFLITPDSIKSRECAEELVHAVKNGKRLIPLVVREINSDDAPKELKHINWIFFNKKGEFDQAFQKLLEAINTDYEWVQTHRRIQVRALEWERQNKENSFLLRGKDLEFAEGQLVVNASKDPKPTELQREYILKSKKAKEWQQRLTTALSIGVAVIMLILALWAVDQRRIAKENEQEAIIQKAEAEKQKNIAESNEIKALDNERKAQDNATLAQIGEVSALAISRIDQNYNDALLYSVEAYRRAQETGFNRANAQSALLTALESRSGLMRVLPEHNDWITGLTYSPDGKTLASASWDYVTNFWDFSNPGNPIRINTMKGDNVAFSPKNRVVALSSVDEEFKGKVVLWDFTDRSNPIQLGDLTSDDVVAFTPNGLNLITLNSDNKTNSPIIQIWDVSDPSNPTLASTLDGSSASLSPDGRTLAIGRYDENVGAIIDLWDIADAVSPVQQGRMEGVFSAFNPNGKILAATNFDDKGAQLWDISDPKAPKELGVLRGHADMVSSIAFNSDGTTLALGSNDGKIYLWDVHDPANPSYRPFSTLNGHSLSVRYMAFSRDGNLLTTGSNDGTIMLWNLENMNNPLRMKSGPENALATSYNGKFSMTQNVNESGEDFSITFWDLQEPVNPIEIGGINTNQFIDYAMLSDNGKSLVSSHIDQDTQINHIVVWDVSNPSNPVHTEIQDLGSAAYLTGYSPDGKTLVISDYDEETGSSSTTLWNVSNPTDPILVETMENAQDWVIFSPNSKSLVIPGYDANNEIGLLMLWDVSNPAKPVLVDTTRDVSFNNAIFSPDGNSLALMYVEEKLDTIALWDVSTPGKYTKIETLEGTNATFSPDDQGLAVEKTDAEKHPIVQLWDISNRDRPAQITETEGYSPIYSPDGKLIVIRKNDIENGAYNMVLWNNSNPADSISGDLTGHTKEIKSVTFSPDGKTMASASNDKTIILWDISDAAKPVKLATLNGHSDWINTVIFSPNGTMLASGGDDHNVILWGISDPKDVVQIGTLKGHLFSVNNILFSKDGRKLVSYGDSTIIWDLDPNSWMKKACNLAGSNFTQDKWSQLFPGEIYRETCVNETLASAPIVEAESNGSIEPVPGTTPEALPVCTEEQSATGCVTSTLEERSRFCVENVSYTLYAVSEGTTLTPLEEGFICTDEGIRSGYQLYTCYSLENPNQDFQANMCNTSCAVAQSEQCNVGFGLDLSQTCCTPVSSDGCVEVTLEVGVCR